VYPTNFTVKAATANLTGTPSGPSGYYFLLPAVRLTKNFECGAIECVAWDTWYRNFNRSDLNITVDVQTIDFFINQVVHNMSNLHFDSTRVFLSGWSNGAAMALLYALNTPNIAAASVYSSTNPYKNKNDPCPQTPYPS
jgi:predicted esterase